MPDVIMPKMGDAMTEGKILRWHKKPGDAVGKGEALAEIETDKVNVDIEAEDAGTLLEILVAEGQAAPVGARIAVIGTPGERPAARPSPEAVGPKTAPPPPAGPAPAEAAAPPAPAAERVKASPVARRIASERGVDLTKIAGTGPEGRITKEDVEAFLATLAPADPTAPAPAVPAAEYEDVPLTRMRQTIARRMSDSKQRAPHFYVTVDVLMDEALRARAQLNAVLGEAKKVSLNDFVIKAAALALRGFPNINSAFVDGKIRRFRRVHVASAIALPDGLIAPVLRDADRLSIPQIGAAMRDLAERTRTGRLRPEEYEGGTFTISNLGMFDVESFTAIINPPHAAILAVGSAQPRAVVREGAVAVASVMKLTLSADHRVTDGAEAARFLAEVKRLLEHPLLLFLDQTAQAG